jgi:hypothetical protein
VTSERAQRRDDGGGFEPTSATVARAATAAPIRPWATSAGSVATTPRPSHRASAEPVSCGEVRLGADAALAWLGRKCLARFPCRKPVVRRANLARGSILGQVDRFTALTGASKAEQAPESKQPCHPGLRGGWIVRR